MTMDWLRLKLLGKGSYGSVFLARLPAATVFFAVKSASATRCDSILLEKELLCRFRGCPEIVRCLGENLRVEKNGLLSYNLFLEYAPGGTLENLLQSRGGRIPEFEAGWYASMLLKGLSHVHQKGFVHCDLKPSNILVFPFQQQIGGMEFDMFRLKIADFGLSAMAESTQEEKEYDADKYPRNRGTLLYSSPESLLYGYVHGPIDIWSFGCIVFEMLTGHSFFRCTSNTSQEDLEWMVGSYRDSSLEQLPDFLSASARDFLRRCLCSDFHARWTADMLLSHPFITENDGLMQLLLPPQNDAKLMRCPEIASNSSCRPVLPVVSF